MAKRVFIIHGWEGTPEEGWLPWLKQELESRGFIVDVPSMPDTNAPCIESWVSYLAGRVKKADKETYFVGHSIGCQAILRYLETLPANTKVGGVVMVAPWVNLTTEATPDKESYEIAKPWLKTMIHWGKVLAHTKRFVAIYSDNDPYVPLTDSEVFEHALGAKIIIEKGKGHFSGGEGVNKLPVVLKELLKMVG